MALCFKKSDRVLEIYHSIVELPVSPFHCSHTPHSHCSTILNNACIKAGRLVVGSVILIRYNFDNVTTPTTHCLFVVYKPKHFLPCLFFYGETRSKTSPYEPTLHVPWRIVDSKTDTIASFSFILSTKSLQLVYCLGAQLICTTKAKSPKPPSWKPYLLTITLIYAKTHPSVEKNAFNGICFIITRILFLR